MKNIIFMWGDSIGKLFLIMTILFPSLLLGFLYAPKPQTSIGEWYNSLIKPDINPPKWVFSVVWTILYSLMGLSVFYILKAYSNDPKIDPKIVKEALKLFFIQYVLNLSWMPIFFKIKSFVSSFFIILLMIFFIVLTMIAFYEISKIASYLLIPYLIWSCFAAFLSFRFLSLNGSKK